MNKQAIEKDHKTHKPQCQMMRRTEDLKQNATAPDAVDGGSTQLSRRNQDVIHSEKEGTWRGAWGYSGRRYEATYHPDTKKLAARPGQHGM